MNLQEQVDDYNTVTVSNKHFLQSAYSEIALNKISSKKLGHHPSVPTGTNGDISIHVLS